jgi:hypothetical protein
MLDRIFAFQNLGDGVYLFFGARSVMRLFLRQKYRAYPRGNGVVDFYSLLPAPRSCIRKNNGASSAKNVSPAIESVFPATKQDARRENRFAVKMTVLKNNDPGLGKNK